MQNIIQHHNDTFSQKGRGSSKKNIDEKIEYDHRNSGIYSLSCNVVRFSYIVLWWKTLFI